MPGRDTNAGFVGAPGQGKTRAARFLLRARARTVTIDPSGSERGTFTVTSLARARTVLRAHHVFDLVVSVRHMSAQDRASTVEGIVDELLEQRELEAQAHNIDYASVQTRTTLLLEEFAALSTGRRGLPPLADEALRMGRHDGLAVWVSSQRFTDLSPDVRAGLDLIYIYRLPEQRDFEQLRALGGRELEQAARSLADHCYIRFDRRSTGWEVCPPMPID